MPETSSDDDPINGAVLELTNCLEVVQMFDLDYASCIMNTGLFELLPTISIETDNRTSIFQGQLAPGTALGTCRLMCTAPTTIASSSCCQATEQLRECKLSAAENASRQLQACKSVFDRGFQFTHECSGVSSGDVGLVVATGLVLGVLCAIAGSTHHYLKNYNRELQKVADIKDSQQKTLDLRLARRSKWRALLFAWRQITNLVWKNLTLRQRKPVALVIEQLLPVLLSSSLVLLANLDSLFGAVNSAKESTPTRTYQASANETEIFCVNYTISSLLDFGGPNSTMTSFYASGQAVLGMFFLVAYIKFVSSTTTVMVLEKEMRIREIMKIMGLSDFTLLSSWYLTSAILSTPLAFMLAAELKFGNVFPSSELSSLVFLFWALSLSIVAFSYFITPFFSKSRTAAVMSVLLWVILYFPFYAVQPKLSHSIKFWAALSPPTAFGLAIDHILRFAQLGTGFAYSLGIQKSLISVPSTTSMSWMLVFDAFVLALCGWYLEQVLPQEFGVRKPWYFLFSRSYWRQKLVVGDLATIASSSSSLECTANDNNKSKSTKKMSTIDLDGLDPDVAHQRPHEFLNEEKPDTNAPSTPSVNSCPSNSVPVVELVEPVGAILASQEDRGECLRINNLQKNFQTSNCGRREEKAAVKKLNLTLYSGQITALLGHNGAGKTTTISMLTGLIPPSAGDATMFGRSIRGDIDQLRRIIGICPQHDVLFNDLTVEEHLQFFGTMKHVPPHQLGVSITKLLDEVGLIESRNALARTLSGGQKRKLSVAIAFIGDSKLVFLDEPTSGMDPYSRRFAWNLLQKSRAGRVIVLTTHFMDEADILGDRIAILSDGKLRCAGSPLFLKSRLGAGYNLTAIKKGTPDPQKLELFLQQFVQSAACVSNYGSELIFQLPVSKMSMAPGMAPTTVLPDLLEAFETNMDELGISQYSISVTTLEQVFLRLIDTSEQNSKSPMTSEPVHIGDSVTTARQVKPIKPKNLQNRQKQTSVARVIEPRSPSFIQQLMALTVKRVQIARRDKKTFINSLGIPILFLVILVLLPRIEVADFLQDYEQALPTLDQQSACPVATINASLLELGKYKTCLGPRFFEYCNLGVISCNATQCCDSSVYTSPWYPCNNCEFWPRNLPIGTRASTNYRCYNRNCIKKKDAKLQVTLNAFLVSFIVMLAFVFIPAAVVAFIVREKDPIQNSKALQLISGTSISAYWLANWIHDITISSAPIVLAAVTIPLTYEPLMGKEEAKGITLLVISHVLASISLAYLISRRFTRHAMAQTALLVVGIGVGGLLSIFSFLCRVVDFRFSPTFSLAILDRNYLRWIFLLVPGYALNTGIYEIATRKLSRSAIFDGGAAINKTAMALANPPSFFGYFGGLGSDAYPANGVDFCVDCWDNNTVGCCIRQVFDLDVAGAPVYFAFVEAALFTILLLVMENLDVVWSCKVDSNRRKSSLSNDVHYACKSNDRVEEDSDVKAERERVEVLGTTPATASLITIRNLHHEFSGHQQRKVAIQNLSLAITAGECFGYLGINGAGKSTTIKVLTAQLAPSSGFISLDGQDLSRGAKNARHKIGYCPQFDALHDLLTVQEQLTLYARLKGVHERNVNSVVAEMMTRVDLLKSRNQLTKSLSGGNKRKVSTAIALIGSPQIVLLDEPSTGVDPGARRKLWNVISDVVTRRQACVVLTTHSMEECEALCTRVGVLVSGALQCLGSIAHLKHKFGRGYSVEVKLGEPSQKAIKQICKKLSIFLEDRRRCHLPINSTSQGYMGVTEADVFALEKYFKDHITESISAHSGQPKLKDSNIPNSGADDRVCDSDIGGFGILSSRVEKIINGSGTGWYMKKILQTSRAVSIEVLAKWWAKEDQSDGLLTFFQLEFPGTELVERQDNLFRLQVPRYSDDFGKSDEWKNMDRNERKPHEIFRALEHATHTLGVSEYGVSDTSLEHIFNKFASHQQLHEYREDSKRRDQDF